jgi:hypothetical protein
MLSLTDKQLGLLADVARHIPVEKRSVFLQRVAAMLRQRQCGRRFDDNDVREVAELATCGLTHHTAPSAAPSKPLAG